MVNAVTQGTNFLAMLEISKAGLITGVLLMALVHSALNVALSAIMFAILAPAYRVGAAAYFGLALMATTTLIVGAIFLLLLLPLAEMQNNAMDADVLATILKRGGFYAYQLGMAIWGTAGLILVFLLNKSNFVPKGLTGFGAVGYAIFVVGAIAEISGYGIGVMLSMPAALFEISLSLWLIFKGFSPVNSPNSPSLRPDAP